VASGVLFCTGSPCAVGGKGGAGWLVPCAPTPAAQPTSRAALAMPAIGFRGVAQEKEGWRDIVNMVDYLA
jgi:hypothetical protein